MNTTLGRPAVALALCAALAQIAPVAAQSNGAYTSPFPAGTTEGYNVLFFGNSFTISATNPKVNNPPYPGARGIPELVRRIAIAGGHEPPFVKNVFHQGRGYDYHVDPGKESLAEIDEPRLDGETWDFVVLQGYSTRPTTHPYMGNFAKHRANGLKLFDEVRIGTTNHVTQSPEVIPVLYQTWAREPGHWLYDPASSWTAGTNIGIGTSNWTLGPVFAGGAEQMARQIRAGYETTRGYIDEAVPGTQTRVAPAGDVWRAAGWPSAFYSSDHYHADSQGDLATALAIYGTIWEDDDTSALIASGELDPVLAAIGVSPDDALLIAGLTDQVLANRPAAEALPVRPLALLVDFSTAAGAAEGAEVLPQAGRHYNVISDLAAGAVLDAVDTRNRPTGIDILIVDGFAGETGGGATGAWNGAVDISGSLYDERAQLDAFFVGQGSGFSDPQARIEVRGLNPDGAYRFRFHGSRNNQSNRRVGSYTIRQRTEVLDAAFNLNMEATLAPVRPDPSGAVEIEIDNGFTASNFAYLAVLEITRLNPDAARIEPLPR